MSQPDTTPTRRSVFAGLGPAIITASVVLGPGSILSASKIGHQFGYRMTWVLAAALALMVGITALSARLGVTFEGTLCDEVSRRAGRPLAAATGLVLFLIAACFQFGNNLGVLAAIEPFYNQGHLVPIAVIVAMNIVVTLALFRFRSLYRRMETLMKVLVGLMLIGFAGNLLMARPDVGQAVAGLVPWLPTGASETLLPHWQPGVGVVDHLVPVTALLATTFSVAGAFYQSYLVRQKGWTLADLNRGLVDSVVGIGVLGLMTLMILVTAAAVLHDNPAVGKLTSAADVARQLEPTYGGPLAEVLFCVGIFSGAFSSFLVNAMIGGSILSDGLGLGGYIDQPWPKRFTVLALATGMTVAVAVEWTGQRPVGLVIFAQALTVLGTPLLAGILLWLAWIKPPGDVPLVPLPLRFIAILALVVALSLALRTAVSLVLPLFHQLAGS